jgi:NAD(P)-dependent dehydrogenase (short-subunit alcohol dehydrogenase family)
MDKSEPGPGPILRRLENKVAIVTGAGSSGPGIGNGKAISVLFARHGAHVMLVDNDRRAVDETRSMIDREGGSCNVCIADVTNTGDVRRLIDQTLTTFGSVDILVNNVGIVEMGSVVDASEESWDRVFAVNLRSAFVTMKHTIPHMIDAGGGSIVNISSVAGIRVGVPHCSYSASKAALNQLTKCVAIDFGRQGIRANAILPGFIDTPMPRAQVLKGYSKSQDVEEMLRVRADLSPTGAQGVAWDVAGAALFLASPDSNYVNGLDLTVDGGFSAKHPTPA